MAATCARLDTLSFWKSRFKCVFTVFWLMCKILPISWLVLPILIHPIISSSRGVTSAFDLTLLAVFAFLLAFTSGFIFACAPTSARDCKRRNTKSICGIKWLITLSFTSHVFSSLKNTYKHSLSFRTSLTPYTISDCDSWFVVISKGLSGCNSDNKCRCCTTNQQRWLRHHVWCKCFILGYTSLCASVMIFVLNPWLDATS